MSSIKKWATIISGQPRSDIYSAKKDYEDFIDGFEENPDVFTHMMLSDKILSSWGDGGWKAVTQGGNTEIRNVQEILDLWSPKNYLTEKYEDFSFVNKGSLASGLSMTYGIKKSFELLSEYEEENNIKYDYVIKWRYDLFLCCSTYEKRKLVNNKIDENSPLYGKLKYPYSVTSCDFWNERHLPDEKFIEEVDQSIDWKWIESEISDQKTVVVSPGWNWGKYGCCDMFLVGSRNAVEKYSKYHDLYENIIKMYEHNESVLRHCLEKEYGIRVLNYFFGDVGNYR